MHFEGSIQVPAARKEFYEFLLDPRRVISILPDVQESKVLDPEHFSVKAKVGMGYLRGTVSINFEVAEKKKDAFAKLLGHGQGLQSSMEIALTIQLEDSQGGSKGRWAADVSVGGLLAGAGSRLVQGAAEKYVVQITENLRRALTDQG